ncbi:MAG TPA: hypothetical protein VLH59_06705 [Ignavibacteriaceae bacterium]|nr:hypothetical protein [Ignavibacteriaceae bacterium]
MRRAIFGVLAISLGLLIKSCDTTDPPDNKSLALKLEDVSCTEAWIELTTTNLQLPTTITLKQTNPTGDTKSHILNLISKDSLLYIDSLLPNKSYQYLASNIEHQVSSNELSVITMDTTSHNFTLQTWTFGEHSHSRLNDVAIINDNIWAVGEIYMNDSLGNPDPNLYNLIKWNGSNWKVERVYYNYQGSNFLAPLRSIFAFSENDVWVGSNQPMHWNGIMWEKWDLLGNVWEGWINRIWGSSSPIGIGNDLYVVGNNGNIARYFNGTWSGIESGTDVDLKNIWGAPDGTVWACGYSGDYAISSLLKISGQKIEKIYEGYSSNQNNGYYIGPISGVWGTINIRIYLMNWSGIYIQANSNNLFLEKEIAKFSDVGFGIAGTDDNNIFSCGEGFVGHWNGISYTEYPELYKSSRTFLNVSVKGNTVAAVGSDYNSFIYSQAVIALSK